MMEKNISFILFISKMVDMMDNYGGSEGFLGHDVVEVLSGDFSPVR